jgi:hypothetical protein
MPTTLKPPPYCKHGQRPGECATCCPVAREAAPEVVPRPKPKRLPRGHSRLCVKIGENEYSATGRPDAVTAGSESFYDHVLDRDNLHPRKPGSDRPSKAELVMKVAAEQEGDPFTLQELAVACWAYYPEIFGLAGYEQRHVDFHAFRSVCDGSKRGLIARGYLVRVEGGRFRVGEGK